MRRSVCIIIRGTMGIPVVRLMFICGMCINVISMEMAITFPEIDHLPTIYHAIVAVGK